MPKTVNLCTMSAKYLVDFLTQTGWATKGHLDIFCAGQLLAEVLPRFEDPPVSQKPETGDLKPETGAETPAPKPETPAPLWCIPLLPQPHPACVNAVGAPDWPNMSRSEVEAFRIAVSAHNKQSLVWCRVKLAPITLSDTQLELCQRVLKFYAPRSEEEKSKDDKQKAPRPELPINEFTFQLLRELNLSA